MNFEQAKISTIKEQGRYNTVHVTSDGGVYLNGNIKAIEKHAKENDLELFHIKPEKAEKKTTK